MDDVIAIRVRDSKRRNFFFVTWGRVFHAIDSGPIENVVRCNASKFGITKVNSVSVCDNLGEASSAHYFYEALLHMSREKIPFGKRTYEPWRKKMAKRLTSGKELYFCGRPKRNA